MPDEPKQPQSTPDPGPRPDSTLPLPTEPLLPWGRASVPDSPYVGKPALVAKPEPAAQPSAAPPVPAPAPSVPAPSVPAPPPPAYAIGPAAMPVNPSGSPQDQQILVRLGEVAVSSTTIHTPNGAIPLRGSYWSIADQWQIRQRIPPWAIAVSIALCAALLLAACLLVITACLAPLSFLFLLARESVYQGVVQVTISNHHSRYVARLPVASQRQVQQIHSQVHYVRSLAAI